MRRGRRPSPTNAEAGQVAGIEVLPFVVLIFVVGSLLLANAWAVIDAKMAASNAASQAARTYAETPAGMGDAEAWARAALAGDEALRASGVPAGRAVLHPSIEHGPRRCARVVVDAAVTVPAIVLPWIGGFGDGLVVHGRHSELVDPYRSGLEGEGCG